MLRDNLFRKWYDERLGVKSESFAYDVWCAAWEAGIKAAITAAKEYPKPCECPNRHACDLHDKCLKSTE